MGNMVYRLTVRPAVVDSRQGPWVYFLVMDPGTNPSFGNAMTELQKIIKNGKNVLRIEIIHPSLGLHLFSFQQKSSRK